MGPMTVVQWLRKMGLSEAEAAPAARYGSDIQLAWNECQRGDLMLRHLGGFAASLDAEGRKKLVLVSCACASLALPFARSPIVSACLDVAEQWVRGEASIEQIMEARQAARATYVDTPDSAAVYATYTAATSYAYAYATDASVADAIDYAYTTAIYKDNSERKRLRGQCADVIRQHYHSPLESP